MSNYRVLVSYDPERSVFVARAPELPHCSADGATRAEALTKVEEEIDAQLRNMRESGGRLVVMEAPLHPVQALLLPRKRIEAARAELARLADAEGFTLLPKQELPELGEGDFQDWVHANARGRERLTAFLADYIARTL